jgi:hypothetical protein
MENLKNNKEDSINLKTISFTQTHSKKKTKKEEKFNFENFKEYLLLKNIIKEKINNKIFVINRLN